MFALFNKASNHKPDPRFVDMEGFDAQRKRRAIAYINTPAVIGAAGAGVVLCATVPLLMGFGGLPFVSAVLLVGASSSSVALYAQRAKLRPLEALDAVAVDREGRHPLPEPKEMQKLWSELAKFQADNSVEAGVVGFKVGLMLGVCGYSLARGDQGIGVVSALAAALFIPHLATNLSAIQLCRKIQNKTYTFCHPPALSDVRHVKVENTRVATARVPIRARIK